MNEGLSRKNPAELHKEVLEHLTEKFDETTDPAEQEKIAQYAMWERTRVAKKALESAQQEQAALQALREKLGIARTETEHFDLSPEIAEAVATEQATKEKFEHTASSNTGDETIDDRKVYVQPVYQPPNEPALVQPSANQTPETGADFAHVQAAQTEMEKEAAELLAFRKSLEGDQKAA